MERESTPGVHQLDDGPEPVPFVGRIDRLEAVDEVPVGIVQLVEIPGPLEDRGVAAAR